jgi:CheY-like chemotaxis protein
MLDYIKGIFAPCCKVRTASNGRHALEVARRESPHLILSDLMMPRMCSFIDTHRLVLTSRIVLDGYGLLAAVRDDPELRHIPIILLTARVSDNNRVEGIVGPALSFLLPRSSTLPQLSGADDFLPKPFSSRELLARANLHLQLGKRKRQMELRFEYGGLFRGSSIFLISRTTGNDHPSYTDLWTLPQSAFFELTPMVIWSTATKASSSCLAYPGTIRL